MFGEWWQFFEPAHGSVQMQFFPEYFQSLVGWICKCRIHRKEGRLCLQKWWGQKPSLTSTCFFIYLKWLETEQDKSLADKRRSCNWRGGLASEAAWSSKSCEQLHHYWVTRVSGGMLGMCEVTPNGINFTSPASHSEGNRCQGCFQLADPVLPESWMQLPKRERFCPWTPVWAVCSEAPSTFCAHPILLMHLLQQTQSHPQGQSMVPRASIINPLKFSSTQKVPANCIFDKKLILGIQRTPAIQQTKLKWQRTWIDISPMKIHTKKMLNITNH